MASLRELRVMAIDAEREKAATAGAAAIAATLATKPVDVQILETLKSIEKLLAAQASPKGGKGK